MKKIGWFTTARGPGSFNLFTMMMERLRSGDIDAKLSFVFINRDVKGNEYRANIIRMAEENGIPVEILPSDTFMPELKEKDIEAWRDAYGKKVRERISKYDMDFGVLAGYMLIVDPETCRQFPLINLHPALPDTYQGTWEEIVEKVVDNNDPEYGSTVHICSPELDRGEVITFDSFKVEGLRERSPSKEELIKNIRAEEVRREAPLLMETVKMLVEGTVVMKDGSLYDRNGRKVERYFWLGDRIN